MMTMMKNIAKLSLPAVLFCRLMCSGDDICAEEQKQPPATEETQKTIQDVIPLTVGNLRGHKMLYNEGWYIVTSSSRALDYAKEKSIISSKEALRRVRERSSGHTGDYKENISEGVKDSYRTGKTLVTGGTNLTGDILDITHRAAKEELTYADEKFSQAAEAFVQGNISIAQRTEEDRQELAALPGNYFRDLRSDFSNVWELTSSVNDRFAGKIEVSWDKSFQKASREFQAEYERSGEAPNTLMALGPILYGYLKSFYHGLVAPSSKTIVKAGAAGGTYAMFLPVAGASVVTGRTVQAVGLTFYYAGKTGVKIISPTVEGGLLSGLSLLSLSAVPVTYVAGGALGAMNQVAFSTAGPALGTLEAGAKAAGHTASYVGFLAYDGVKGATRVVINQAKAGVVLGYNALTAIPTHLALGASDAALFLAWDGPRLAIAAASGKIKTSGPANGEVSPTLGDLPVGTVVDLKKLETTEGMKIEIISTDEAVIRDVLEKIPCDLREKGGTCEKN